jgi:hypothetical protein
VPTGSTRSIKPLPGPPGFGRGGLSCGWGQQWSDTSRALRPRERGPNCGAPVAIPLAVNAGTKDSARATGPTFLCAAAIIESLCGPVRAMNVLYEARRQI